jgi:hypothetical protein
MDKIYGLGAEFTSASELYHAAEKVRDKGFIRWDAHSPFPIHGMDDAMGLGRSRLSFWSLTGGAVGLTIAFLMIFLISDEGAIASWFGRITNQNYPLVVHGKPYFAAEPSVPIFFELTILITAFGTIAALLVMNLLPRLHHPVFNWDRFAKVTDDKFFIVIESRDPKFDEMETKQFLEELGATCVALIKDE